MGLSKGSGGILNNLEKLLYLNGVSAEYFDYSGRQQIVPWESRLDVLRALGYDVRDDSALRNAVFQLDAEPWKQLCKSFNIAHQEAPRLTVFCTPDSLDQVVEWQLVDDTGRSTHGSFMPADMTESGDYHIGSTRYSARELPFDRLSIGYYQIKLQHEGRDCIGTIAVCPSKSFQLRSAEKIWGVSCQLYTLRSERNWGIGDFSDLQELIELASEHGCDLIGLNPLHAPSTERIDSPSPYSPSDRRALNPLYIDLETEPEFVEAKAKWDEGKIERLTKQLNSLRNDSMVDYQRVTEIKYSAFESMYSVFLQQFDEPESKRAKLFKKFVVEQGECLEQFCTYEMEHNRFATQFRTDIRFFQYLQWLASMQLVECQNLALKRGMKIGLMGDLAVGAVADGCEVQSNLDLYLPELKIGAPPDPFSEHGQNWGLPVPSPVGMRQQQFRHFRDLLRTNMRCVGALRIDHVMALMRLWWCLPGEHKDARDGIYVYYPMTELMALLRLESQLNECAVVGEDLGVVPYEFRDEMRASGLYSNKVFYFEQELDGQFRRPNAQQSDALLMVTNHDVPSLSDWWSQEDLLRRQKLGLLSDAVFEGEARRREQDKYSLLAWLKDNGTLCGHWGADDVGRGFDFALCESIHRTCARTNAVMMVMQLEDLQIGIEPVNIPGTHREYPNWRRKQSMNTDELFISAHARNIIGAINEERRA